MNRVLAQKIVLDAGYDALADLLMPALAIRPRVLYAAEPKRKRARWLDWLFKTPTEGVTVETVPVLDDLALPIGTSRFDSVPDVPIGFEWPCTKTGEMMECVAQINLAELNADCSTSILPKGGWLLFFIHSDPAELGHHVAYFRDDTLTRWSTFAPRQHVKHTCRLEYESVFSLPDAHDWCIRQRIEFVNARIEPYVKLQEKLTDGARHYLLGYPRAIADDVRARCVAEQSSGKGAEECGRLGNDYSLLLQLDSDPDDDGPGWMWGDAGTVYYVIRNDDLRAGRFDRTRLVAQSC